tara:strand:+ start:780 stop:929 length:150 start_codon:yes stop_codon:yes gene_type:complete
MPKKKEEIKEKAITQKDIDSIWDVIDEMQKNLDFINSKLERVLNRMGLE